MQGALHVIRGQLIGLRLERPQSLHLCVLTYCWLQLAACCFCVLADCTVASSQSFGCTGLSMTYTDSNFYIGLNDGCAHTSR